MTPEEYVEKYEKLTKERGTPPSGWWIGANHKQNMKHDIIRTVYLKNKAHYERELKYQKGLAAITKERLKDKLLFVEGNELEINNIYYNTSGVICMRDKTLLRPDCRIKVRVMGDAGIDFRGLIYFPVCYKYGTGDDSHFHLFQDEILQSKELKPFHYVIKPTLGIIPQKIHNKQRRTQIIEAIFRCIHHVPAPQQIPVIWIEEYNELCEKLNK